MGGVIFVSLMHNQFLQYFFSSKYEAKLREMIGNHREMEWDHSKHKDECDLYVLCKNPGHNVVVFIKRHSLQEKVSKGMEF